MKGRHEDTDPAIGDAPQTLLLAIEQLVSGERSVGEFRDEMVNLLYEQPTAVSGVRGLVDDYARRGLVPEQIHRLLITDIDKASNEDQPTTPTVTSLPAESTDAMAAAPEPSETTEETRESGDGAPARGTSTPREASPLEVGSLLRERFEIVARAPGGSMGIVYKAIDHRLAEAEGGRPYVAIKVLAPVYAGHGAAMRALQQEAAKGRYLSHPNIVRFLDLDRCDGRIFLVMEWLEGRALSTLLAERPGEPVPITQALDIVGAVGAALVHAHRVGVTHADVKPGNIMLLPGGGVKLLDFGIARARGDLAGKAMAFDNSFLQAATPAYASPHVLAGGAARPVDDVYSLACVTYRLLSGRRVFGDKTALEARKAGLVPARIRGLGGRRWRALESALALNSDARTQSVASFLDGLGVSRDGGIAGMSPLIPWLAGLSVIALAGLAILSPRLGPDTALQAPTAEMPAISASSPPAPAGRSDARPPPRIPFEVTRADPVDTTAALPPASLTIPLPSEGAVVPAVFAELRLSEDAGPSIIRLQRDDTAQRQALQVRVSPQTEALDVAMRDNYALSTTEPVFEPGQRVVDIQVEHLPDAHVEPDSRVGLAIAVPDGAIVARIDLELLDDDRQQLATPLPPDTVGFSRPEYRVRESEAAVPLTVWRFNPGDTPLEVALEFVGGSASADDDFALTTGRVRFEPGESVAVVYLPLVLDNSAESEETIEILLAGGAVADSVYRRTTVRIADAGRANEN